LTDRFYCESTDRAEDKDPLLGLLMSASVASAAVIAFWERMAFPYLEDMIKGDFTELRLLATPAVFASYK
jgi:hypothetical protein